MNKKVLIVEDQFVEANDIQIMLRKAGYEVCGIARSVESAREILIKEKPGLVLLDIFLKGKLTGIDLARQLMEERIAFIYLSANSNEEILSAAKETEPYGFIVKPFREKDLLITLEIAQYRHEHSQESRYRRQADLMKQLEKTTYTDTGWKQKLLEAVRIIQQEIPFDYVTLKLNDNHGTDESFISFLRIGFNEYQTIGMKELAVIRHTTVAELSRTIAISGKEAKAALFNNKDFETNALRYSLARIAQDSFQVKSSLEFPLMPENGGQCCLSFYSRRPDTYNPDHISLLFRIQQTLQIIIKQRSTVVRTEKENGSSSSSTVSPPAQVFEGIIGTSHLLLNVFNLIKQVAPFDTAVLILGESGTGKERIAECIHNLSTRKNKPLVKINCATLPASLIESELFGHEKGAFTGAVNKRTGKFEQANGGTIFLDEIGEMPVDLQAKLLRVLQEKEIEPIGGKSPVKIDVRVIAATNRNLEREVGEGRFRLDLYYRLNVFPIAIPALRERLEDIPALCQHFITIYNRKSGKNITGVSDQLIKNMQSYHWPGNIRELENLIERSVLLATGAVIEDIPLGTITQANILKNVQSSSVKTIHENERDYIINVLKKCNGKIWGDGGAAQLLDLPPSTLKSKMKKLDIEKGEY